MTAARAFDSGLVDDLARPVAFRTAVRNGVIALLSRRFNADTGENDPEGVGLLKVHGGYLEGIEKLAGPLAAFQDSEAIQQVFGLLLGRAPSICVAVGDREVSRAGTSGYRDLAILDVHLYFINNHKRSLLARVEADVRFTGNPSDPVVAADPTADPGVDVMMELAEELLIGQRVDTDRGAIKQIELKRETVSFVSNTHVITEQRYTVQVSRSINHNRGRIAKLLGVNTVLHPPTELPTSPAAVAFTTELGEET